MDVDLIETIREETYTRETPMRTLHLFSFYLGVTEVWLFNLLNNLPDTEILVASKHFFLTNFYSPRFKYIEFPIKNIN